MGSTTHRPVLRPFLPLLADIAFSAMSAGADSSDEIDVMAVVLPPTSRSIGRSNRQLRAPTA